MTFLRIIWYLSADPVGACGTGEPLCRRLPLLRLCATGSSYCAEVELRFRRGSLKCHMILHRKEPMAPRCGNCGTGFLLCHRLPLQHGGATSSFLRAITWNLSAAGRVHHFPSSSLLSSPSPPVSLPQVHAPGPVRSFGGRPGWRAAARGHHFRGLLQSVAVVLCVHCQASVLADKGARGV